MQLKQKHKHNEEPTNRLLAIYTYLHVYMYKYTNICVINVINMYTFYMQAITIQYPCLLL